MDTDDICQTAPSLLFNTSLTFGLDNVVAMSTAKRSRRRQSDAQAASPQPASKRLKTTTTSHVPTQKSGLGFLVDENARHGKKLEAKLTNGVPSSKTTRVDESHAVVAPDTADQPTERQEVGRSPDHAIDISSGEESSEDSEDDREDWNVNGLAEDASAQQMVRNVRGLRCCCGSLRLLASSVAA